MSRFQFVDHFRTEYSVKRLCDVLKLNRSAFYKWKDTADQRQTRLADDAALAARITAVFDANNGCYGAKRITAELNDPDDDGSGAPGRLW